LTRAYAIEIDTIEPIANISDNHLLRLVTLSSSRIDRGIHTGHTTSAKARNICAAAGCHDSNAGLVNESHKKPSQNCCMEKMNGIAANGKRAGVFTYLTVATPIAVRAVPAIKLVVAEKHIRLSV